MRRTVIMIILAAGLIGAAVVTFLARSVSTAQARRPLLILYSEENFGGRSLRVTETLADLPAKTLENGEEFNWNDEVRSLVVMGGTWRLYQHGRCNTELDDTPLGELDVQTKTPISGWSCLVSRTMRGPLRLPSAAAGGFHRDVSSIELVSRRSLPDWAVLRCLSE